MAAPISLLVHVRSCSFQAIPTRSFVSISVLSKTRAGALIMRLSQQASQGRQAILQLEGIRIALHRVKYITGIGTLVIQPSSGEGQY